MGEKTWGIKMSTIVYMYESAKVKFTILCN